MLSLSAIGLFYGYVRHNIRWRYGLVFAAVAIVFAAVANFVRVLVLILLTYYFGDRAAQGFLHGFAGMLTFSVALLGVMAFDEIAGPLRRRLGQPE
jgi:exosortase/archaeosortase family protein